MDGELRQRIGTVVRELRCARGMSQRTLARAAKLDQRHVWGVERGEAGLSIESLAAIASGLDMKPSALLVAVDL